MEYGIRNIGREDSLLTRQFLRYCQFYSRGWIAISVPVKERYELTSLDTYLISIPCALRRELAATFQTEIYIMGWVNDC